VESSCEFGDEWFHKMLGNYRVASELVASRVVLSSIKLGFLIEFYSSVYLISTVSQTQVVRKQVVEEYLLL
jgi:hypothetical protein